MNVLAVCSISEYSKQCGSTTKAVSVRRTAQQKCASLAVNAPAVPQQQELGATDATGSVGETA